MPRCFKLSPTANAHPADVVAAKIALRSLGHYEAPDWGIREYPDRELFDAIKDFQAKQGLKVDGVINSDGETVQAMAQRLQAMGRNGDTILAHINPAEAELLDRVTDGGSVHPLTGLLEFGIHGTDFDADDSVSDEDFWGGYEAAMDAFDSANTHGTGGFGSGNDQGNGSGQSQGNNQGGNESGEYLSSENPDLTQSPDQSVGNKAQDGLTKAQMANALQNSGPKVDEEGNLLGADGQKDNGRMPVSYNPENPTLPGNYNEEPMIEDVERQNEEIMARSEELVADRNAQNPNEPSNASPKQKTSQPKAKETRSIFSWLADLLTPSPGPSATMEIAPKPEDKELLDKAERIGIDPNLIDPSNPLDQALVNSYVEYGDKTPEEKQAAQDVRAQYSHAAETDERMQAVYDDFKMAEAKSLSYMAGPGSYGYLSNDRLNRSATVNNYMSNASKFAGTVTKNPVFAPVSKGYDYFAKGAEEELGYRK